VEGELLSLSFLKIKHGEGDIVTLLFFGFESGTEKINYRKLVIQITWKSSYRRLRWKNPEVTVLNPSDLFGKVKTCFSQKRYGCVIER
jgi:hypothetical protein